LPEVLTLTPDRIAHCQARLKVADFPVLFERALARAQRTPFLRGENPRGWMLTFDWLINNEANARKVLEGKYGRPDAERPEGAPPGQGKAEPSRSPRSPLQIPVGAVVPNSHNPWPKVLAQLQREINAQSFATWLKPTRLLYTQAGCLYVGVPSAEFALFIHEHYGAQLTQAIRAVGAGEGKWALINLEDYQGRAA
jgi:hypothetical protein